MLNKMAVSEFWLDAFLKRIGLIEGLLALQSLVILKKDTETFNFGLN